MLDAPHDRSFRIDPGARAYGRSVSGVDDATVRFGRRYEVGLELRF